MEDTTQILNSVKQLTLQSAGYPDNSPDFHDSACQIDLPEETKVRVDIYELSYHEGNVEESPFCLATSNQLKCAEMGAVFDPLEIQQSSILILIMDPSINLESTFYGRYWVLLSGKCKLLFIMA